MLPLLLHLIMVKPSCGLDCHIKIVVLSPLFGGCKRTTEGITNPGCDHPWCQLIILNQEGQVVVVNNKPHNDSSIISPLSQKADLMGNCQIKQCIMTLLYQNSQELPSATANSTELIELDYMY